MVAPHDGKPPSKKRVGARIRVKAGCAGEAARLFEERGFTPIYVEHRDDGDISFWFGNEKDEALYRIANSIPREFYAIQGVVVGNSPPFAQHAANDC
ncbi:hypothetical protein NDN01_18005 [Sphingomonas sp. QA11]|uniref:hypothetical protein n=1 Tax=Sphingomonas sp. QA11 TaxID=2950605 RepID=UPI002349842E|nr:hypothetical protein [Sphingomonas sp. QA11]WCM25906.1 hypothetical protein NDN01_18005 [Sphingomonas sp. QA11]